MTIIVNYIQFQLFLNNTLYSSSCFKQFKRLELFVNLKYCPRSLTDQCAVFRVNKQFLVRKILKHGLPWAKYFLIPSHHDILSLKHLTDSLPLYRSGIGCSYGQAQ